MLQNYGNLTAFLGKFNPDMQLVVAKNQKRAFMGEAPSLGLLKKTYGGKTATIWLLPQICDLCEFTNSKGKIDERQAEKLAEMISIEYGYMKVTELLLFFYRLKCGRYGKFYGAIDPMAIMMALDQFRRERNDFLAANRAEDEEPAVTITAEEYFERKGITQAERQDIKRLIERFAG